MVEHVARIGESIYVYRVWWGNLRERNRLVEPNLDGRIIFKRLSRSRMWGMNWIDLAQDGNKC